MGLVIGAAIEVTVARRLGLETCPKVAPPDEHRFRTRLVGPRNPLLWVSARGQGSARSRNEKSEDERDTDDPTHKRIVKGVSLGVYGAVGEPIS